MVERACRPQEQGGTHTGSKVPEKGVSGDALERGGGGGNLAQGFSGVLVWCAIGFPHKGGDRRVRSGVVIGFQPVRLPSGNTRGAITAQTEGSGGVGLADGDVEKVPGAVDAGECDVSLGGGAID